MSTETEKIDRYMKRIERQAINGIKKLVLGKCNDILKIFPEEVDNSKAENTDLFSVTEIKCGSVTIKFADRTEALKLLFDIAKNYSDDEKSDDFINAVKK